MAGKPVLFAVDDDREVLRAVERDLRRKYGRGRGGDGYRILSADSAASAMDTLGKLTLRGDTVALFLVDQRMPRKTGVEFLEEAQGRTRGDLRRWSGHPARSQEPCLRAVLYHQGCR